MHTRRLKLLLLIPGNTGIDIPGDFSGSLFMRTGNQQYFHILAPSRSLQRTVAPAGGTERSGTRVP